MTTPADLAQAQTLYVAYYGRPADPGGLTYWADQIQASGAGTAVNAFGNSAEYDARFGNLSNTQLVNNLYQQMFGRDAEPAGLDFYTEQLNNGAMSLADIALAVANGAQNADAVALRNKVTVANHFTAAIETPEELEAYQGNAAADAARGFLMTVNPATDPAAVNVDVQVQQLVEAARQNQAQDPSPGQSFRLTAESDVLVGTDGDDTFLAPSGTLQASDQLEGDAGQDTLVIAQDQLEVLSAGIQGISGFERLAIGNLGTTLDASTVSRLGFTEVSLNAAGTASVINLPSGSDMVTLTGGATDLTLSLDDATGIADSLSLTAVDAGTYLITANGVEALNITTVNANAAYGQATLSVTANQLITLNVTGSEAFSFDDVGGMANLATVDASGLVVSGLAEGQYAAVIGVETINGVTVFGSNGADILQVGNNDIINGRGGNDLFQIHPTASTMFSTINDFQGGDQLDFFGDLHGGDVFHAQQITLANSATFEDYLNAATVADVTTVSNSQIGWFQFDGDTYVVQDNAAIDSANNATDGAGFDNGVDGLVRLTGLIDLSEATHTGDDLAIV